MTNKQYIRQWVLGKNHDGPCSSLSVRNGKLLSYKTTIADRLGERTIKLNTTKYSQTTTKHQTLVKSVCREEAITVEEFSN